MTGQMKTPRIARRFFSPLIGATMIGPAPPQ
jgi:hypothetical protein